MFAERDLVHVWTNFDAVQLWNVLVQARPGGVAGMGSRAVGPLDEVPVVMISTINGVAWAVCGPGRRGSDFHVEQGFQDVAGAGAGGVGGGGLVFRWLEWRARAIGDA